MTFASQPGSLRHDEHSQALLATRNVAGAWLLALLLLCGSCATIPTAATNRLATTAIAAVPLLTTTLRTNSIISVHWVNPDTNVWLIEWSTNLIHWQLCGTELAYLDGRSNRLSGKTKLLPHLTDTSTTNLTGWFVRLRRR